MSAEELRKRQENIRRRVEQENANIPQAQISQLTRMDLHSALVNFLRNEKRMEPEQAAKQIDAIGDKTLDKGRATLATKVVKLAIEQGLPRAADCLMRALREEGDEGRWYEEQYTTLQRWAHQTLDSVRAELTAMLWPVCAHVFLILIQRGLDARAREFLATHRAEHEEAHGGLEGTLTLLSEITTASQLPPPWGQGRADVAKNLLGLGGDGLRKYEVHLSRQSFEQLLQFVDSHKLLLVLHILNTHVSFRFDEAGGEARVPVLQHDAVQPNARSGRLEPRDASKVNLRNVKWGLLADGVSDDARDAAERAMEKRKQAARARAEEEGKFSSQWKYKERAAARVTSKGASPTAKVPIVKQRPAEHLAELAELRQQVTLGRESLPSCCCYTVYNSGGHLNTMQLSFDPPLPLLFRPSPDRSRVVGRADASIVAGGFDDSTVRVWDLRLSSQPRSREAEDSSAWAPPTPRVLRGHSGPVYACALSQDYQQVLSASEDGVRCNTCRSDFGRFRRSECGCCL